MTHDMNCFDVTCWFISLVTTAAELLVCLVCAYYLFSQGLRE